jgi:hypothetical protein
MSKNQTINDNGYADTAYDINQDKQYGFDSGYTANGDIIGTEEVYIVPTRVLNAVFEYYSPIPTIFPVVAGGTTIKIKAGATDYVTITIASGQTVTTNPSYLPCTVTTPLIAATPTTPIQTILSSNRLISGINCKIYLITNS